MCIRDRLKAAIDSGIVREEDIDLKVQHILQTLISFGMLDGPRGADTSIDEDCEYSREAALAVAREGLVLLKNDGGNLPLNKGRVLVMGPNADRVATGGGSGFVTPIRAVSAYQDLPLPKGRKMLPCFLTGCFMRIFHQRYLLTRA